MLETQGHDGHKTITILSLELKSITNLLIMISNNEKALWSYEGLTDPIPRWTTE